MTDPVQAKQVRATLALYWGTILLSLMFPWLLLLFFEVSAHRRSFAEGLRYVHLHFFAPGYNFFLIGVLNAAPFALFAVFVLFHLGPAAGRDQLFRRRRAGIVGSLTLAFGVSFWTHVTTLAYPDAQGAFAYFMLPVILVVLLPMGYAAGRVLPWLRDRFRGAHG